MIDAEASVVTIKENQYICKLPNGDVLTATKKQGLLVNIGDVVTFAVIFNGKTHQNKIHKIVCVRRDLLWQDIVQRYFREIKQ